MKNIKKITRTLFILTLFVCGMQFSNAQVPPPPPENGHGQSGNQPAGQGGGAPIGGGIAILLSLGAAWGGRKVYQAYKDRDRLI